MRLSSGARVDCSMCEYYAARVLECDRYIKRELNANVHIVRVDGTQHLDDGGRSVWVSPWRRSVIDSYRPCHQSTKP